MPWTGPRSSGPTVSRRFPALHTVIIGAGEVGLNTARMLSHEGHSVVLVEQDEKLVEKATEELDALVIAGNGANPKLLDEAGIKSSDLLVAASNSDEVNIIACLAAKAQGVSRTVARIHNPDYYEPGEPFAREMLGIDFIIHTEQMAALEIKEALLVPGAINVDSFAEDTIEVAEVILNEGSEAVGRALEKAGMSVRVIERDESRARYVASQLRKGFVLHDEGISRDFLLQEGVDRTDAFVAVTGDDRANLLAAMYARQLGARMTIAGISRGEFAPLADALGVDLTISPRMLAAEAILRFVRKGEVIDVALLASGAERGVPPTVRSGGTRPPLKNRCCWYCTTSPPPPRT